MQMTLEEIREMSYDELKEHVRLAEVNREHYYDVKEAMQAELAARNPVNHYKCVKCGHSKCETREMRVSPSFFTALANWNTDKYAAVVCARCKYTEFYHSSLSDSEFVAEAFIGS